jgi:probable F420-dependent oxidoreductase
VKLGLHLGNYSTGHTGERLTALALHAEAVGFDSVWVSDHVVAPGRIDTQVPAGARGRAFDPDIGEVCYEAIVLLSALSAVTARVRLGTSVLIAAQRNPLVLAKQLSTLDALSNGRLDIGVGGGWLAEEFAALNVPFSERWARLEETLDIFSRVWTQREADFTGATYAFGPVRMAPKPAAPAGPRITVGGRSPRALRIAGQRASGLNASRLTPEEAAAALKIVREHAEAAGRDPDGVTVLLRCDLPAPRDTTPDPGRPWLLSGTADAVRTQVETYAEHGVSELIVSVQPAEPSAQDDAVAWLSTLTHA